jgi:hypothetical protein
MIQQKMEFNGPFGAPKFGPVKQSDGQVNDRRIHAHEFILKAELFLSSNFALASLEQLEEDDLIELPGAMFIGIGQGGMAGSGDAQVFQFSFAAPQPSSDFPERMGPPQLAENHRHKLTPASKPPGMTFGLGRFHRLLKFDPRKKL